MRQATSLEIWIWTTSGPSAPPKPDGAILYFICQSLAFRSLPPNRATSAVHGYNRGSVLQPPAARDRSPPGHLRPSMLWSKHVWHTSRNMVFRVLQANPFDCQTGVAADSTAGNQATSETQRHRSAPPHRVHCSLRRSRRGFE
jgi:hypothetical protein